MSQEKSLTKIQKSQLSAVDLAMNQLQNQIVMISKCKVCNSKYRLQAQQLYQKNPNQARIVQFLKSKGEDISAMSVSNHFSIHVPRQKNNINVKQYLSGLVKYRMNNENRKKDLLDRKAMFNKYLLTLLAQSQQQKGGKNSIKYAAAIKSANDNIYACETQLDILMIQSKPVIMIVNILSNVIQDEMQKAKTQQTKNALMTVLQRVQNQSQGMYNKE